MLEWRCGCFLFLLANNSLQKLSFFNFFGMRFASCIQFGDACVRVQRPHYKSARGIACCSLTLSIPFPQRLHDLCLCLRWKEPTHGALRSTYRKDDARRRLPSTFGCHPPPGGGLRRTANALSPNSARALTVGTLNSVRPKHAAHALLKWQQKRHQIVKYYNFW